MRGQTTLDFAVGVSVFLVTIAFTLAFVPGMLEPFNESPQDEVVIADRAANQLAGGLLGDPSRPYVLNETCTVAFFNSSKSAAGCEFDSSNSVKDRLGVPDIDRLNVSLHGNITGTGPTLACWDADNEVLVEAGSGACETVLATGPEPPGGSQSVVVSRRLVLFGDQELRLFVRVW